jgi:hypothetical protein
MREFAKLQHRGSVRNAFSPKVKADKAAKACAVVQGIITTQVSQVKSALDEVNGQYALKTSRGPESSRVSCLGVVGFDDSAQLRSRNDDLHRLQELVTPCGLSVRLKGLVGCYGKGLLLHDQYATHDLCGRGTYSALP